MTDYTFTNDYWQLIERNLRRLVWEEGIPTPNHAYLAHFWTVSHGN